MVIVIKNIIAYCQNLFGTEFFKHFCIPLITTYLCIFIKTVSRNDKYKNFKKEDLAVGIELAVTSLIIFITDSANLSKIMADQTNRDLLHLQTKYELMPWIILAFAIGLWSISTIVRKLGWKNDNQLRIFSGIILPDLYGIITLIFVVNWVGN